MLCTAHAAGNQNKCNLSQLVLATHFRRIQHITKNRMDRYIRNYRAHIAALGGCILHFSGFEAGFCPKTFVFHKNRSPHPPSGERNLLLVIGLPVVREGMQVALLLGPLLANA